MEENCGFKEKSNLIAIRFLNRSDLSLIHGDVQYLKNRWFSKLLNPAKFNMHNACFHNCSIIALIHNNIIIHCIYTNGCEY